MKETNYNYNVYGNRPMAGFYLPWNVKHIKYDKHYTERKIPVPRTNHEEGVEHEQNGKLYEAIQFYKRAVQLVPDIEFRLYDSTIIKTREWFESDDNLGNIENGAHNSDNNDEDEEEEDDDDDEDESDLFVKLSRIINRNQCVCFPQVEQSTTHISALPMEIILYILRWVVSLELDLRVWGVNCGTYDPKYQSWRDMYVQRPRLRYNGCYISKTSYIRHGENSFQDQFYKHWHLVEYFRYLRFFPEGKVLMLTSTDDAQVSVNSLKNRIPRNSSVLIGHYRLCDNFVTLVLKRQDTKGNNNTSRRKRREAVHDSGEQTFHAEFEIQSHHRKINSQLSWIRYNIFTVYRNGQESCDNAMNFNGRYPPFKFSRVKSYTQESEAPLQ
ncbi:hypothetical protein M0802_015056 [Mischocyttarus mexicanus]|nr:hypothetical protein M0802_015056 [Mischocyttarus mexicanus]